MSSNRQDVYEGLEELKLGTGNRESQETSNALQAGTQCQNPPVCGLDRYRFGLLSQKSARGYVKLVRGLFVFANS
jgi:hypothetical protein